MRIFTDLWETYSELTRDLKEMGELTDGHHVLRNYTYAVMRPDYTEMPNLAEEWAQLEWKDRVIGGLNPGKAWKKREDVWRPRLELDRGKRTSKKPVKFWFTHSFRMGGEYIQTVLESLRQYPDDTHVLSVWRTSDQRNPDRRRPQDIATLFYRQGETLEATYLSRESDLVVDFPNDVALTVMLQWYMAQKLDWKVGYFHHFIGKLWAEEGKLDEVF